MDEEIRLLENVNKTRTMIFSGGKLVGAVNSGDLEEFIKDGQLNLIAFINHKRC